jgi:hypothetical protein
LVGALAVRAVDFPGEVGAGDRALEPGEDLEVGRAVVEQPLLELVEELVDLERRVRRNRLLSSVLSSPGTG